MIKDATFRELADYQENENIEQFKKSFDDYYNANSFVGKITVSEFQHMNSVYQTMFSAAILDSIRNAHLIYLEYMADYIDLQIAFIWKLPGWTIFEFALKNKDDLSKHIKLIEWFEKLDGGSCDRFLESFRSSIFDINETQYRLSDLQSLNWFRSGYFESPGSNGFRFSKKILENPSNFAIVRPIFLKHLIQTDEILFKELLKNKEFDITDFLPIEIQSLFIF